MRARLAAIWACQAGKDVYVGFNSSDSYVAASHDYGDTFSAPVMIKRKVRSWSGSALRR